MKTLLTLLLAANMVLNAQVCCSPVGSAQAGGGALMNNWRSHWPNALFGDDDLHWFTDIQLSGRGPAGNIQYGPQLNLQAEVSRSFQTRNVLYMSLSAAIGTIQEHVTFIQAVTWAYTGQASTGLRRSIGNRGQSWIQIQLAVPAATTYAEEDFPFGSENATSGEVVLLHNQRMPWFDDHPDLFSLVSMNVLYSKNLERRDDILRDNLSLVHLSAPLQQWYPVFLVPFLQLQVEQLLTPPSIWTTERDQRTLTVLYTGFDLAFSKPGWDLFQFRAGVPMWTRSSANGFPDGTQPAAYLTLALNWSGIFNTE